jgi:2,3-dihydroxyphenylpropionate 1,2-dioxygenase
MNFALICASHTPLLLEEEYASASVCSAVRASFARMASFIEDFAPEVIIQFSPDHFHGFHYDNMPSFCVGTAARSYGDWGTSMGSLQVDEALALGILNAVRCADIDLSVSYDMIVDHGFVQIWETMFNAIDFCPIVPIFINCIADPLPFYRRVRLLGDTVGRFSKSAGKRVLFAASGGLSHDPVVPKIRGASAPVRERLMGRSAAGPAQQAERERQVRSAAMDAMNQRGPARPLNSQWDLNFLRLLGSGAWAEIDAFTPESIDAAAGSGGNEILCWVAATAALAATSAFEVVQSDYIAIDGWIAGMAHFSARPKGTSHAP